jgi:hypothetical protein
MKMPLIRNCPEVNSCKRPPYQCDFESCRTDMIFSLKNKEKKWGLENFLSSFIGIERNNTRNKTGYNPVTM